eukprot:3646534-Rhodomonas_salina.3
MGGWGGQPLQQTHPAPPHCGRWSRPSCTSPGTSMCFVSAGLVRDTARYAMAVSNGLLACRRQHDTLW